MITLHNNGVFLAGGVPAAAGPVSPEEGRKRTMAWSILQAHNISGDPEHLQIRFDAMVSHDITYVGIIQTARASGMQAFPLPYVLTNCHNSLCAVGGTINEDDHQFALSAAHKYGGIYVPPCMAVIHSYNREMMAGCGKMILGSDSHTRYGAYGTMAIGEGGPELARQLLSKTYNIPYPKVIAIYLTGTPIPGVGPQDVALELIRSTFKDGVVKNAVMEFFGPGVANLSMDYRSGIDVMTTETTCLSSIWPADHTLKAHLAVLGRGEAFKPQAPADGAYYDGLIEVELDKIRPMIALPFHPSNAYTIDELQENLTDILRETEKAAEKVSQGRAPYTLLDKVKDGQLQVQQGVIGGCAGGTFTSIAQAANVLRGKAIGAGEFTLNVYPSSIPVYMELMKNGALADLMAAGSVVKTAFCGPCFGAGDVPANNGLSLRHTTRNFPNREGSKPGQGQMSAVALMDARSIAASAARGGLLTSAEEFAEAFTAPPAYHFDPAPYQARVYQGFGRAQEEAPLFYGPNIKDWPQRPALEENILLKVCSKLLDEVTTTDELIPSGETSSYRSNPLGLAEFTLSRRDPAYVGRAKEIGAVEEARERGESVLQADPQLEAVFQAIRTIPGQEQVDPQSVEIGSVLYANKPGDGSAREQAASCQRVLGGLANITQDYATKRYRSNVMNWGMLPFHLKGEPTAFEVGDYIYVPGIRSALEGDLSHIPAYVCKDGKAQEITLYCKDMTESEREIVKAGCLINFNRNRNR